MAYAHPRLGYHRTRPESKHPAYFDEDDSAVLDPAILDADIMQSPHGAQFRKDSFANSNGVLSPADSHAWDQHFHGGLPVEPASANAVNLYHDENNGFVPQGHPHPHPAAYGHPHGGAQWAAEHGSGHCTPATGVDFMPPSAAFDAPQYVQQRTDGAHGSFSHPPPHPVSIPAPPPPQFHAPHGEPGFIPAPQVQTPMSPHSHQDWMGMVQQEMESRPMPKRMRPNSPPPATMVDYARRDGIRKKNGRIDIPQERNIHTIDELIDKTTDEDLLKELKQQKRLLRNREAALASRQRKKKHTEDLELKEKGYTQQINLLETSVTELQVERQHREEERQVLLRRLQESHRHIETLQDDIRNLKLQHNEEASNLRRKVNILTDQLAIMEPAPAMSAAPSSTGFTDFNAEMEALNMGPHDWDDFFVVDPLQHDSSEDFNFNQRQEQSVKQSPVLEKRPSSSTVVPSPSKKQSEQGSEQPFATGLLFLLLLCGAYVASKPPHARPADLPNMPPEVQAAAPTVLKDLLAEAGASAQASGTIQHQQLDREPQPSHVPQYGHRSSSRMDQMHHRLTAPTRQQEIEQAFSLTTAQYASITNMPNTQYSAYEGQASSSNQDSNPRPRRNLAQALANFQQQHQPQASKAEVYTRSLLWDQIPSDVVKQFKEMVRDHEEIDARQQNQRSGHNLKAEAQQ